MFVRWFLYVVGAARLALEYDYPGQVAAPELILLAHQAEGVAFRRMLCSE